VLLSRVDAPAPIRHENLTSAQDCPGFWIRSSAPRRNEHGAVKCASESRNPPIFKVGRGD